MLFAQLVDDPSARPDRYPTEADQDARRRELFELIEQLVVWENTTDTALLARAHQQILDSTDGTPPAILDPFAGGGSIPLEAQRLGLEAHASDLNPVAVLINKALIEIPPKWAGRPPVFPGAADAAHSWPGTTGLAEDVRRYGQWMRDEAERRIGYLYPKAKLPDGTKANVIAWIWARTVTCPNPACGIEMPLVRSWWLGKKKGKGAYVVPRVVGGRVEFEIGHDITRAPTKADDGTVTRTGARCVTCGTAVPLAYIRTEGKAGRIGARLMATAVGTTSPRQPSTSRRLKCQSRSNARHRAARGCTRVPRAGLRHDPPRRSVHPTPAHRPDDLQRPGHRRPRVSTGRRPGCWLGGWGFL